MLVLFRETGSTKQKCNQTEELYCYRWGHGRLSRDVVPAITGEAGPLTIAQVMVTPVLKVCLVAAKKTVVTECCPDAPEWRPYEIYDMGDKVKRIKLFHKETGEEIDQVFTDF